MHSVLLVLWCNLAVALSASTNYQPRGLSAGASGSLSQQSYGSRALKSINDSDDQEEPQTSDAPNVQNSTEGLDHAEAALKKHFANMKESMEKLQKSSTSHKEIQTKVELEKAFANAKKGMLIVMAHSRALSSLTGVSEEQLDKFFTDLTKSISKLHRALKKSDHKLQDARAFFAHLIKSISHLETSSEDTKTKSEQVKSFFTKVISSISILEESLESPDGNPTQASAKLKAFFMELGVSVSILEAQMQEQGPMDKTQSD